MADAAGSAGTAAKDAVTEAGEVLKEFLTSGEDGNGLLSNLGILDDETKDKIGSTFKTILAISLGLVAVVVICAVLPHIIKFFDFLKSRKKDKDGKK